MPTTDQPTIAVLGATGHLGRLAVEHLLQRGVEPGRVVATGRAVERLEDLAGQGVRVLPVERDDAGAVRSALEGVDRVLLVSGTDPGRVEQHRIAIEAAADAGVELLGYTSGPHADTSSVLLMADHRETEELLEASAVPSVVLRNAWYVENYTAQVATYREHGMVGAAGEGRVSLALRREYAEAAAAALTGEGHAGKVYELGGPAVTMPEIAEAVSAVIGEQVAYTDVAVEALRGILADAGVPAPMDAVFADVDRGIAAGELLVPTEDLERLLGRPATPLRAAVEEALSAG
ncbi:SDR family oxidoreductase [Phycicoccus endophyticus]|uniref:SDR family oxidoreductase n=1 Tax=Phycicoccus endophyticus TaxID=1690220 RepID=A0A7G9R175_9MICO|nr:SDR family oxidoreductase [Phycicoccus endophyticus]NHI20517.1 SDR family oxidoreductase [Phycicoccus endophyticus]QNN49350.1 SDR family oxidoreductase [Phycicoccus endophyticus]GGL45172.1 NAD(P)-dependent oxidoreductase [Phycicoccus endophyticus]